jgi:hypothetical protein
MKITLLLYLIEMISHVDILLGCITIIGVICTALGIFLWCITNDGYSKDGHEQAERFLKFLLSKAWIFIITLVIQIFIPTKTTMYLMLGTNYLSDSTIPAKVGEILNLKLEDVLKQLKKEKKDD